MTKPYHSYPGVPYGKRLMAVEGQITAIEAGTIPKEYGALVRELESIRRDTTTATDKTREIADSLMVRLQRYAPSVGNLAGTTNEPQIKISKGGLSTAIALAAELSGVPNETIRFYTDEGVDFYRGRTKRMVDLLSSGNRIEAWRIANYFANEFDYFVRGGATKHDKFNPMKDLADKFSKLRYLIMPLSDTGLTDRGFLDHPLTLVLETKVATDSVKVGRVLDEVCGFHSSAIWADAELAGLSSHKLGDSEYAFVRRRTPTKFEIVLNAKPSGDDSTETIADRVNTLLINVGIP